MQLTRQQQEQFNRDGFLLFPGLFSKSEIAVLRQETARLSQVQDEAVIREHTGGVRSIFRVHEADGATRSAAFRALVRTPRVPASVDNPNTETPWYRGWGDEGTSLNHAWFIGFAPANRPQVAFAVMIEYGGSGGFAAHVATGVLQKCIAHGYVTP